MSQLESRKAATKVTTNTPLIPEQTTETQEREPATNEDDLPVSKLDSIEIVQQQQKLQNNLTND